MIDLDEIGRIERRREPWGVGRVDSTADTGADERLACPPEKRWGRCPSGEHRPYQPRFLPTLTDETKGNPSGNAS